MKAAVIENFGAITVRDVPEPTLGEYDALCELLYGSTCTGTDTHLIQGHPPFCHWVKLPFILGHESVGRVVKLGSKVRHYRVGDLVTRVGAPASPGLNIGWGGFAEFGIARDHWALTAAGLPAGDRVNQIIPPGIDPTVGPMFVTWRETLSALLRLGVSAGSSVLVAGSGGNGLAFAVQARNLRAKSVAVIGAPRWAGKFGADCYVDYKESDYTKTLSLDGFDFIIDAVGQTGMPDRLLPCLKAGGRYLTYGLDNINSISFNPGRARGAFTVMPCSYDEAETHQQVSDAVRAGKLDASLWYAAGNAYPLAQISEAYAAVQSRQTIKSLVRLRG